MAGENIRILIIEDDLLFAEQMRLDLEEMGYIVIDIADNAKAALHMVKISKPELVLMDINLNGIKDGISIAEEILILDPVPIIFVTSLSDKETFDRAKRASPFAYFLKPTNKVSLQHAIELAIENFNKKYTDGAASIEHFPFLKENLLIKQGSKLIRLNFSMIHIIEVEEKYCSIYSHAEKYIARISLKDIITRLPHDKFMRIHRNFVVNVDEILLIDLEKNLVRTKYKELPLGRKYRSELINSHKYIS